jgi:hypothetical protein
MPADKASIGNPPVSAFVHYYVDRPAPQSRLSSSARCSVSSSGMTTTGEPAAPAFSIGRFLLGVLLSVLGHAVAVGATFIAGAVVEPSAGGGFEDVAAAVGAFFVIEALLFVAVLVFVIRYLIKRRYDLAIGLFLGWLAGPIVYYAARFSG